MVFGSRYFDSCRRHDVLPNPAILSGFFKVGINNYSTLFIYSFVGLFIQIKPLSENILENH